MEGRFAVPFHFAVEFLVLVVAGGAALDAIRARRHGAGAWALGQALGFFLLCVAQVLHGSLILQPDADIVVLVLRVAGFGLLALFARPAVNVITRARARATGPGPALVPSLFLPGALASYAIAPGVAAMAVAARGVRAHREDQDPSTFAFAAAFVAFGVAEFQTVMSPADGGAWLGAAHGVRALGALFLARWLWSSVVRSVRMRFVASLVAVLTITVLLIGAVMNVVIGDRIVADQLARLSELGEARVTSIYERGESAVNTARLFAGATPITQELSAPVPADPGQRRDRRSRFDRYLQSLASQFEPDFIVVIDGSRRVRGTAENLPSDTERTGRGRISDARSLAIAGLPVVRQAPTYGVQLVPYTAEGVLRRELVVIGAWPSTSAGSSARLGVVAVGFRLDRAFLQRVKEDTGGADATLVVASAEQAVSTLSDTKAVEAALDDNQSLVRRTRETGAPQSSMIAIGSEGYATSFVPITTQRGSDQINGLLALSLRGDVLTDAQLRMTRTLFILTLIAMAVAAVLAWMSGGRVTRPIRSLTHAARELRGGNLEARAHVGALDEVGALGTAFNEMAAELQRTTGHLRDAAATEATLRAHMEAILQSMGDGLIATDGAGKIVTFNRAAERMLDRRADRALGKALKDVMEGTTSAGAPIADAALRGQSTDGSVRAGTIVVPVALTSAPLLDADGKAAGRVIVLRDMSSEFQAERMKREFLANVSHELRTPITPIKGYADILARKKFPREKVLEFLEAILESTERLERIADILVDFAALEAGRLQPKTQPLQVRALLDQLADRWRDRASKHTFVRRGGTGLPPLLGDQRLLLRSLDELVDNAVKFSPKGGPIEIIAESYANGRKRGPEQIRITVRDRGIGIEPERMPDLFEDFRQLDGSETRSYGGLGLGLAYVKRIATVHGGDVQVESKPGRGSSFSMVLPVATSKAAVAARAERAPAPAPARRKAKTTVRAARGRAAKGRGR